MILQKHVLNPTYTAGPLGQNNQARFRLKLLGATFAFLCILPSLLASSVTLTWYPSPSSSIMGYIVYSGTASGNYTNKIDIGNNTTVTLSNLVAGSTYYFVVTCYNAAGDESAPSNEAFYSVPAIATGQPVTLGNPSLSGGNFSFNVPGPAGTNFVIEASVDLINWVRLQTNTAPFTFIDPSASQFPSRYYRTVNLALEEQSNATPQPGTLDNPALSSGNFSFVVSGTTGIKYAVEASVDLINWVRLQTNTAPFTFTDPDASQFPSRYYRTISVE